MGLARVAADVAALLPAGDPLGVIARERLQEMVDEHDETIWIGSRLRDASVDPLPTDFIPMREVDGHPGVFKHAIVGEPEYDAAVDAWRRENGQNDG